MKNLLSLISFCLILILTQCTYHNEDYYFKDNPDICYTEDRSFVEHILPILENNCISCHNSSNPSGNIILEDYQNIRKHAETGRLLGVIKHESGYPSMPQNASQLSNCTINQIEAWIEQGLKNN